ncbi:FAD-dependent oxidoreductase [Kribbella jiaozuonensis]|uniref:FAD-dependent oxidoreductase n=1 Tax=Kribbella jiaozuonensis TaxID=2575441 RepID=A0A4V6XB37_9ACTN|nr:FAD-dependent oxidoreductase [Kribbella jiaozuonensis]TKK76653.1 FAD-dependent oxidoreductase [Kribbella jiaozuonensis]
MSLLDRRTVLKAGSAAAAVALTGCGDTKDNAGGTTSPSQTPTTSAPSTTAPTTTAPSSSAASTTATPSSTPTSSAPTGPSTAPNWNAFSRSLTGKVYLASTSGYAAAHQLFNPRWDSVRPTAVVKAANPADVQKAINFARTNKLVLVPKSGGHSYVGASTIANGMQLDVGGLKGMSYSNGILTVGAGARLYDVHAFLDRYGRSLPTGTCPTVGVAGLTLGGGMGIHTRTYGLTCDRVVSMGVFTADGKSHNVSATVEPDLFWALRGSGGGNLGVVTSFRFSTIPATKLGFFRLTWPESQAAAVVRGWQKFAQTAPTTAWGNLHIDAQSNGTLSIHVLGVSTTGNANAAAAQLESFVGAKASARTISVKTHMEAVKYLGGGTTSPRQGFLAGSDVLKGAMDAATITALLGALKAAARAKTPASAILDPLGGQAAKQPAGGASWPWRSALGVIQWYSSAQGTTAQTFITNGHRAVRTASAGAYVNYLEVGRAVSSYYGGNSAKLQAAKKKYDPSNFFHTPYTLV